MNNPWVRNDNGLTIKKTFDSSAQRDEAKAYLNKAMGSEGLEISEGAVTVNIKNGILSYSPIADTQFYDIYPDFAFSSNVGYLGNKYIVDEKIGVNNEKTVQDLKLKNNISTLVAGNNQDNAKRVLLGSVTTPEIVLRDLCILTGGGFDENMDDPNWHKRCAESNDPSAPNSWLINIKIIPRNISGLKVNSVLSNPAEPVQENISVYPAVFWSLGYDGGFKDFAQIILGRSFE